MEENFKRSIIKRKIAMTATETIAVPEFESRLSVFRVRANFAAPYRKCKFFYLDRVNLKSRKGFLKHVQNVCKGWPNGIYFLKLVNGKVFARYEIVNDEVRTLFKESPNTGKEYLVWDHFRRH